MRKASRKLDGLLPPEVEPLPPLEIVAERGMRNRVEPGGDLEFRGVP